MPAPKRRPGLSRTYHAPDQYVDVSDSVLQEFQACGALRSSSSPDKPTIHQPTFDNNRVHPIFARENWHPHHFTDEQWFACHPAFHLASCFLWEETCLFDYFVRLTHAQPERVKNGSRFQLEDVAITPDKIFCTMDILRRMAEVVRFLSFEGVGVSHPWGMACTGPRFIDREPFSIFEPRTRTQFKDFGLRHDPFPADKCIAIHMDHTYVDAIIDAGDDLDHQRRASFILATTLVHEICHAVWVYVHGFTYRRLMHLREPSMNELTRSNDESHQCELGWQWELSTFNGVLAYSSTNLKFKGAKENQTKSTHLPYGLVRDVNRFKDILLHTDYISRWFEQELWYGVREKGYVAKPEIKTACRVDIRRKWGTEDRWELTIISKATCLTIAQKSLTLAIANWLQDACYGRPTGPWFGTVRLWAACLMLFVAV